MKKRKDKNNDLALELIDEQDINAPAPDFGMKYNGTDMYWYPEVKPERKEKNKDILEEILLLKH